MCAVLVLHMSVPSFLAAPYFPKMQLIAILAFSKDVDVKAALFATDCFDMGGELL